MSVFIYKARDSSGKLMEGELEAQSSNEAKEKISSQGFIPTSIEQKGISFDIRSIFRKGKRKRVKDLIVLTRQFAVLFRSGISMDRILTTLSKQTESEPLRIALGEIKRNVSGGKSLSAAFAEYPEFFDELYVNMVKVGEEGGVLDKTLSNLSSILEKENRILSAIKSATLYPKIVVVTFIGVFILMVTFVIPKFAAFYGGYGAKLPLPTLILMGISDFFVNYWYIMILIVVGSIVFFKRLVSSKKGRMWFDALKFRLPVFGELNLLVANARFGSLLSTLYKSGVSLSHALTVIGKAIGNKAYQVEVQKISDGVQNGATLSNGMEKGRFFTPMMIEATSVGEESGHLDEMMDTTAQFYDEEVSDMLDRLTTLIEPLLLFGLFGMVALLAFAIFLPMWKTTQLILPSS